MKKINTHSKFQSSIPCLPLTREVARRSRDGGRENQIKTAILTTPQSSSMTAPLTRGAKNIDFRPIKIINTLVSIILIILMLCSCGKTKESGGVSSVTSGETVKTDISTDNMDFELTNNDLTYDYDESSAIAIGENEDTVKITSEGTYLITGRHTQITVSAPDTVKIKIVLKNAVIENSNGPAVYITDADKVFITALEGTENTVSDGTEYSSEYTDDNADAAIFSRADLTLNGKGSLTVKGNFKCGIASKDDLVICGLSLNVTSAGRGIEGKDCVKCSDADITVNAGGDGIKSTNTEDESRGYVYIESGSFNITAENDGIEAKTALKIKDGDFVIKTGGGSQNATAHSKDSNMRGFTPSAETQTAEDTESAKALKCSSLIAIDGGDFNIDSADDAIHSNSDAEINGGSIIISSGDDGIHADDALIINGGEIKISKSYEGLEGTAVTISGGKIDITASDDGINAAGGNDSSSMGGRPGENTFNSNSAAQINITGGYILVNASGDGVDSNGSVTMSGGLLLVSGPTDSGNGAFDYNSSAEITGGTAILCGSSGMSQGFSQSSSQASFMYTLNGSANAGDSIAVTDISGKVIASFMPSKQYNNIVVSSPELNIGSSYTVTIGGTVTGCDENGYTASGKVTGGDNSFAVEISSVSTSYGSSGGNMGGGMGAKPDRESGGKKSFGMG